MGRHPKSNQAIWDAARALGAESPYPFTARDVADRADVPYQRTKHYLTGLTNAGYLRARGHEPGQTTHYKFVRDTGVEAPRVQASGRLVTDGLGVEQMWRSMRILKSFTRLELAFTASTEAVHVPETAANWYILNLYNAGYLRKLGCGRYALNRHMNTGPKPPQVVRKNGTVYDPNLDRVFGEVTP